MEGSVTEMTGGLWKVIFLIYHKSILIQVCVASHGRVIKST